MNVTRLRYFLTVVDTGTITHAAAQMHIAQPAMSRQIKTLERELKLKLFIIEGNRLVLTSAGRQFATLARELLAKVETTKQAAAALRTGRVDVLTIGTTVSSARGFLADFIASTTPEDPALVVHTAEHYALEQMLDRGADLIISPVPPTRALHSIAIAAMQIRACFPQHHSALRPGMTEIDIADLCRFDLVVPSASSVSRRQFDAAVVAEDLRPRITAECDDGASLLGLAASGHGIGISTEPAPTSMHSLPITADGRPLSISLFAAWRPEHFAGETITALGRRIKEFIGAQYPQLIATVMPEGHANSQ